ncbi:MAG: hypothetical protein ABIT76_09735 [Chthoniobacterales bacterium]
MKTSLLILSMLGLAFTGCATSKQCPMHKAECSAHKAECHAKSAKDCHNMSCPMHHGGTMEKAKQKPKS